jgi:hypothetical protein
VCAKAISKMDIAKGREAGTIVKNLK